MIPSVNFQLGTYHTASLPLSLLKPFNQRFNRPEGHLHRKPPKPIKRPKTHRTQKQKQQDFHMSLFPLNRHP